MSSLDLFDKITAKYTYVKEMYQKSYKLVLEIKQSQGLCAENTMAMFCARNLVHELKQNQRYVQLNCENCIFTIEPVIHQSDLWLKCFRYFPKNNVKYSPFSLMQIDLMTCKNILMKIGVPKCQAIVPFIVILMEQILSKQY